MTKELWEAPKLFDILLLFGQEVVTAAAVIEGAVVQPTREEAIHLVLVKFHLAVFFAAFLINAEIDAVVRLLLTLRAGHSERGAVRGPSREDRFRTWKR